PTSSTLAATAQSLTPSPLFPYTTLFRSAVANPSGTVTFKDGATTLGTGTPSTTGGVTTATFTSSSLSTTSHNITAVYAGDTNFINRNSRPLNPSHDQTTNTIIAV